MFSTLSGKKAIADDFENRTRCTIYQNRKGWRGFQRVVTVCSKKKENHRRKEASLQFTELKDGNIFSKLSTEWFGLECPESAFRDLNTKDKVTNIHISSNTVLSK